MHYLHSILKLANHFNYQLFSYAGVQQDKSQLVEKYPAQADEINSLPDKAIKWLALRFIDPSTIRETHPLPDSLPTLKNYIANQNAISQKYNSQEDFKNAIDGEISPTGRPWSNPADFIKMTVDEMESILHILTVSRAPKADKATEGIKAGVEYTLPEEDRVGRVGEWDIWLPSKRENSCKIARYDINTLKPETTWCTARTSSSNLYYTYNDANKMLFYVIKQNPNPKIDNDYLSVGFIDGKPSLRGMDGSESVNRDNKGLTPESLESILGGNYGPIMKIMQDKATSLEGKSPGFTKIEEAATSLPKLKSLIKGNTKEEAKDLMETMFESCSTFSEEAMSYILTYCNVSIHKIRGIISERSSSRFNDEAISALKKKYSELFFTKSDDYSIIYNFCSLPARLNESKYFTNKAIEILKEKSLNIIRNNKGILSLEKFDSIITHNPQLLNATSSAEAESILAEKLIQGFKKNFDFNTLERLLESHHDSIILNNPTFLSHLKEIVIDFILNSDDSDVAVNAVLYATSNTDIIINESISEDIRNATIQKLITLLDSTFKIEDIIQHNAYSDSSLKHIPSGPFQESNSLILKDERVIAAIQNKLKKFLTEAQSEKNTPSWAAKQEMAKNNSLAKKIINFRFTNEEIKRMAFNLFFKTFDEAGAIEGLFDTSSRSPYMNMMSLHNFLHLSFIDNKEFLEMIQSKPEIINKLKNKIDQAFDANAASLDQTLRSNFMNIPKLEECTALYDKLVYLSQYGIISNRVIGTIKSLLDMAYANFSKVVKLEAGVIDLANKFYKTAIGYLLTNNKI